MKNYSARNLLTIFLFAFIFLNCKKDDEGADPQPMLQTPTVIKLSHTSIYEKLPEGTIFSILTTDVSGSSVGFSLVAGEGDTDNALFEVKGNQLTTKSILQYSDGSSRSIRLKVFNGTENFESAKTISVNEFSGTYPSLSSPSFDDDGQMPTVFGANNGNQSPDLDIMDVPINTNKMVLTMVDLDFGNFWHWAVWNIPTNKTSIDKNQVWSGGAVVGTNDIGGTGYFGPSPPDEHRYKFTVYFLDGSISLQNDQHRELPISMAGKIIAQTSMIGRYTP